MPVNEGLRILRLRKGLTQLELARRIGVGRTEVVRLESGANTPNATTLVKVLEACGEAQLAASVRKYLSTDDRSDEGLKNLRLMRGLSQADVVRLSGVSSTAISELESGVYLPSTTVLATLLDTYGKPELAASIRQYLPREV